jgi:hypothetical protein
LRGWEFNQSAFEGLRVQPIRFWRAGNSTNQILRGREFSQSGSEGLEAQPIRFWGARSSTNQVILVSHSRSIRFFELGVPPSRYFRSNTLVQWSFLTDSSANKVISLSGSRPIRLFWNPKIRQWDGRTVIYNSRKRAVFLPSPQSMACGKGLSPWEIILKNRSG